MMFAKGKCKVMEQHVKCGSASRMKEESASVMHTCGNLRASFSLKQLHRRRLKLKNNMKTQGFYSSGSGLRILGLKMSLLIQIRVMTDEITNPPRQKPKVIIFIKCPIIENFVV